MTSINYNFVTATLEDGDLDVLNASDASIPKRSVLIRRASYGAFARFLYIMLSFLRFYRWLCNVLPKRALFKIGQQKIVSKSFKLWPHSVQILRLLLASICQQKSFFIEKLSYSVPFQTKEPQLQIDSTSLPIVSKWPSIESPLCSNVCISSHQDCIHQRKTMNNNNVLSENVSKKVSK